MVIRGQSSTKINTVESIKRKTKIKIMWVVFVALFLLVLLGIVWFRLYSAKQKQLGSGGRAQNKPNPSQNKPSTSISAPLNTSISALADINPDTKMYIAKLLEKEDVTTGYQVVPDDGSLKNLILSNKVDMCHIVKSYLAAHGIDSKEYQGYATLVLILSHLNTREKIYTFRTQFSPHINDLVKLFNELSNYFATITEITITDCTLSTFPATMLYVFFPNLKALTLRNVRIFSLEDPTVSLPIKRVNGLIDLKFLAIEKCNLKHVPRLTNLTALNTLLLRNNSLIDLSFPDYLQPGLNTDTGQNEPGEGLYNLTSIYLYGNKNLVEVSKNMLDAVPVDKLKLAKIDLENTKLAKELKKWYPSIQIEGPPDGKTDEEVYNEAKQTALAQ